MPCIVICTSCKPQWQHHGHQHACYIPLHAIHWANLKDVAVSDTFCVYELPLVAFRFLTLLLWWPLCLQAPTLNQLGTCPTWCHVMCNGWRHHVCSVMLLFETWWWARCDLPHVIGCMLCYLAFMSFLMLHLRHVLCHFSIMHCSICGHHCNIMNNSSKHVMMWISSKDHCKYVKIIFLHTLASFLVTFIWSHVCTWCSWPKRLPCSCWEP